MFVERLVSVCDLTDAVYNEPTKGAAVITQGATGRWCEVLWVGPEYLAANASRIHTYEEAVERATELGGTIDF
jgi:hypothetical protein